MATIPTIEEIEKALQQTSEIVDGFIVSETLADAFEEIRTTHKLHLDEAEQLSRALNAVFLELAPFDRFPELLREALEQNSDKFDVVLSDVNEKVFKVFRKNLEEGKNKPVDSEEVSASAPVAVATAPAPSPAQPTTPRTAQEPAPVLLDKKTSEKAESFNVDAFTDDASDSPQQTQQSTQYRSGVDPYREPIE